MLDRLSVLNIRFSNALNYSEIPKFRGAVAAALKSNNVLFHNHLDDSGALRYAYPLIQYKRINGKAAIVCVGQGTDSIGEFFANMGKPLSIGAKEMTLTVESVKAEMATVAVYEESYCSYSLRKWLPLNSSNYVKYQSIEGLKERFTLLEGILTGNILSFAKGLNISFERQITCSITALKEMPSIRYKGVGFAAFDVRFKSNVRLPDFIGLGKGVSHGLGTVVKM
jgi:hypothetical protein